MEHTVTIKILNIKIKSMSFKKRISIWFTFTTLVLLLNVDNVQSQTINNGAISVGFAFGIQSSSNGQTIINNGSITSRNDAINADNHLNVIVINNGSIITNTIGQAMGISGGNGVTITNSASGTIQTSTTESFGIYIATGNNGVGINNGQITISNGLNAGAMISHAVNSTLVNNGTLSTAGSNFFSSGLILFSNTNPAIAGGTLTNNGTIFTTGNGAHGIHNINTNATLINNGVITVSGINSSGIFNTGNNVIISNSNLLSPALGHGISNTGIVSSLTNTGTISSTGAFQAINNTGVITTLNNSQSTLTYSGALPTTYNIIIVNASNYGVLDGTAGVTGSTNFGIANTSSISSRSYAGVLRGLTNANVGSTRTGTFNGLNWTLALASGSTNVWDLTFTGAGLVDTQNALISLVNSLKSTYSYRNSIISNSLNYECNTYSIRNVCFSAAMRKLDDLSSSVSKNSQVVALGYRFNNFQIGAYIDNALSPLITTNSVQVFGGTPLIGVYGKWNARKNGTGLSIKLAGNFMRNSLTTNRQASGFAEAATGSSTFTSNGIQASAHYAVPINSKLTITPFAGIRLTKSKIKKYTEVSSTLTTNPLTYNDFSLGTRTLFAGINTSVKFTDKTNAFISAGYERDIHNSPAYYSADGISGLNPVHFNSGTNSKRFVAGAGISHQLSTDVEVNLSGSFRQEAFLTKPTRNLLVSIYFGL
jgi:hypothetical protein